MSMLEKIHSPADIRSLDRLALAQLAAEMRHVIIQTVARNAGHLAPNLGVVELTLALHRVFDSPRDKIIWDVGHQSYPHKLLTSSTRCASSAASRATRAAPRAHTIRSARATGARASRRHSASRWRAT